MANALRMMTRATHRQVLLSPTTDPRAGVLAHRTKAVFKALLKGSNTDGVRPGCMLERKQVASRFNRRHWKLNSDHLSFYLLSSVESRWLA